jgi:hypothetical protein
LAACSTAAFFMDTKYGLVWVFRISETPVRSSFELQAARRPESRSTQATLRATRRREPFVALRCATRIAGSVMSV